MSPSASCGHDAASALGSNVPEADIVGLSAALAAQVMPGVFIGAEVRNLRHYEGLGLSQFAGQALYVGPTLYMTLGAQFWLSAAWNVQAWRTTAESGAALQSKAGYIDARPLTPNSSKSSCYARPDHTSGSKCEELALSICRPVNP